MVCKMCAYICGHLHMCMYILVFLMCLMYDKDIFFLYLHLFVNRIPGKKVPRQKKAKIFLEGKSDIAINTDNKRNIQKRRRMSCGPCIVTHPFVWGMGQEKTHLAAHIFCV